MVRSYKKYHFSGICGVAMSQAAAWLKSTGKEVTGSDQGVYPPMSDFLASQGVEIFSPYSESNIKDPDCVVIGNALSRGNPEVEAVLERRLPFISLPELLRSEILSKKLPIVVAGTHGKTTTTAALAHILKYSGESGGHLVGGLPIGWKRGFDVLKGKWFAIEGDEYDTAFFDKRPKFLHYQPQVVIVNNLEFDHADIYDSFDDILKQFQRLLRLIPRNGCLLVNEDDPVVKSSFKDAHCTVITYGQGTSATFRSELIEVTSEGMTFALYFVSGEKVICKSHLWGEHQLTNLTAAAATAEFAQISPDVIAEALSVFKGVQRRLELKFNSDQLWIYDDFAHHPTAVRATIASLRARHPALPIYVAFEPRSNTMVRRHFQDELIQALAAVDGIIIGNIHRVEQIPVDDRLNIEKVIEHLSQLGKRVYHSSDNEEIISWLNGNLPEKAVVAVMTNGEFGGLLKQLLSHLKDR